MQWVLRALLLLLFISSGATSLVYETLWIRVLSLAVGSTSASMSIVLSIFFLGLALGSYLSGKYFERVPKPILLYGAIEAIIGVSCFFLLYPLLHFHKILALFPLGNSLSGIGVSIKFILVGLLLLLPTVMMGSTFPILIRIFSSPAQSIGKPVSLLYGINTLGAVIGALATSFYLIPQWGVLLSNQVCAFVNILIFFAAFVLDRFLLCESGTTLEKEPEENKSLESLTPLQTKILVACCVTGFISIACEVVWNKYLAIFFGTNIYGLGIILALYLLGIGIGSLLLSPLLARTKHAATLYVALLVLSMGAILGASILFNLTPPMSHMVSYFLGNRISLLSIKSLLTAIIIFFPTILFGALFPLAIHLISTSATRVPYIVGVSYSINTLGAILGSYLAGIWFIPHLGSSNTIRLVLSFATLLVLVMGNACLTTRRKKIFWSGLSLGIWLLAILGPNLNFENIIKSAYHQQASSASSLGEALARFAKDQEEYKLIVEGETGIISLSHDKADGESYREYLRLKTNGLNESIYNQKNLQQLPKYEALLGLLPYALVPEPKKAFVVGYGGGYTVDFLTSVPLPLTRVIELEKGILTAADYVHKHNNPILKRPSLDLRIEDARFVLATRSGGPYDIIVSQPSHSWLSGAANLFTFDFFEIVKANLTDRGVFSQWLNLYNMDVSILKSILRTFFEVFPYGATFTNAGDDEMILIGSKQPVQFHINEIDRLVKEDKMRSMLTEVPFNSLYDLLSNFSLSRSQILKDSKGVVLNTDINAFAEANQSALFYSDKSKIASPQEYLSAQFEGDLKEVLDPKTLENEDFLYRLTLAMKDSSKYDKFHVTFRRYEQVSQGKEDRYWKLGYLCLQAQRYQSAYAYLKQALVSAPKVDVLNLVISSLVDMERHREVIELTSQYPRMRDKITDCYLAYSHLQMKNMRSARNLFTRLTQDVPGYTTICGDFFNKIVGEYYYEVGNFDTAIPFFEAYYRAYDKDVPLLKKMIIAYLKTDDLGNAKSFSEYISTAEANQLKQLQGLISFYKKNSLTADALVLETKVQRVRRD